MFKMTQEEAIRIYKLANLAIKKIALSYPETPEGKLGFAVTERAILDAYDFKERKVNGIDISDREGALSYLNEGEMYWAEMCGVNSDYIRRVIRQVGLAL